MTITKVVIHTIKYLSIYVHSYVCRYYYKIVPGTKDHNCLLIFAINIQFWGREIQTTSPITCDNNDSNNNDDHHQT